MIGLPGRRRSTVLLALVPAILAVTAYLNALQNPFVFDDIREVVDNRTIEDLSHPLSLLRHSATRPVVTLSYAVDYALWRGPRPFGFHVTNLVLHVANVLLLFALAFELAARAAESGGSAGRASPAATAFMASTFFAVHPLMTEAVGYVSSRSEVLCATFFLGSVLCFARALPREASGGTRRGALVNVVAGAVLFVLALGSRESAIVLPIAVLACDWLFHGDADAAWRRRLTRAYLPAIAAAVLIASARLWLFLGVEYRSAQRAPWHSALTSLHAVVRYLELLFVPLGQSLVPAIRPVESMADVRVLVIAMALALGTAIVVSFRRRDPVIAYGFVWFGLVIAPSSALTLLSEYGQTMAEHRAYLASCGVFMAAASLVGRLLPASVLDPTSGRRRLIGTALVTSLVAVLLAFTIARNRVWADPVILWGDAERKAPQTWVAVQGLADAHRFAGDCAEALPIYQRALGLGPSKPETYLAFASCLGEIGRFGEAQAVLRLATLRLPENIDVRLHLARLQENTLRDYAEALRTCQDVAVIAPDLVEASECVNRNQARLSR